MFLMGDESGAEAQEEAERLGFGRNAGTGRAGSENDKAGAENENGGSSGTNSSGNGNQNSQALELAAGNG